MALTKIEVSSISNSAITTAKIADVNITTAKIADDAVTLAKLAAGTDGELITWDASGNPAAVAVGTATHVLTCNGTGAAPTFQTPAASGMGTLLSSVSVSGSPSTVDFDGLFTSEYTYYKIIATGLRFSSGNDGLWIRFKSGGSWQTATYTWQYNGIYNGGSALANGSTSGTYISLSARSGDNAAGDSMDFEITLGDPLGTTYYKNITCVTGGYYTSYPFQNSAWGTWRGGTGAVTGIRLYSNATTVSGGTVFLYGFKNT